MSEDDERTIRIPDDWQPPEPSSSAPMVRFVANGYRDDGDDRDVTIPVGRTEDGVPIYAPRGYRIGWLG